jgi:hypothetical protein
MEKLLGQNWLTSLGGLISGIGGILCLLPSSLHLDPQWSVFTIALGGVVVGVGAKSFNVHSTVQQTETATKEKTADDIKEAKKS